MKYIFSGSFNPLHSHHLSIAHYVEQKFDGEVIFEFSRTPYDKEPLTDKEVRDRIKQFEMIGRQVIVTNFTSFLERAMNKSHYDSQIEISKRKDENFVFIVGYDTVQRIDDNKYYFGSEIEKCRCLSLIDCNRAQFLVFPRDGEIDKGLSEQIRGLCIFARDFVQSPISSSSLRERGNEVEIGKCRFPKKWLDSNNTVKGLQLMYQYDKNRGLV